MNFSSNTKSEPTHKLITPKEADARGFEKQMRRGRLEGRTPAKCVYLGYTTH